MTCRMFLFAYLALALDTVALAEWKYYGGDRDTVAYFDTERVRSEPPYVTVWVRMELETPDILPGGQQYRSQIQKLALDCKAEAWGVIFSAFYATKEATGSPIETRNRALSAVQMQPAIPGSIGVSLLNAACREKAAKK